jgi:hypothetical protein
MQEKFVAKTADNLRERIREDRAGWWEVQLQAPQWIQAVLDRCVYYEVTAEYLEVNDLKPLLQFFIEEALEVDKKPGKAKK